ncbi:MAG TPA: AraC family transcriptional regulator [Devosia sp.]|nr:AraC family transcriptional regulator [Devosia sp.]
MDVLSEVLRAVRLTGAVFFDVSPTAPWAIATPAMRDIRDRVMPEASHVIAFHVMLAGSCWVETVHPSLGPFLVEAGDVILLPRGDPHVMGSAPGTGVAPDMTLYYRPVDRTLPFAFTKFGGGGTPARFVCGYLGCDATPFNPLLDALPRLTVVRTRDDQGRLISDLIAAALSETGRDRPGTETVLAKLSEVLLVQALRTHLDQLPADASGWLGGLRDPHVGRALQLIHGLPAQDWTLPGLAREVGLSRSALAERFTRLVRETPMHYLGRWRMQLASHALEQPEQTIAAIAEDVGYQSEAAFNRAFKKYVGAPPGAWRRARAAERTART